MSEKSLVGGSSFETGTYVHEEGSPLQITVSEYNLGRLIGLMLTVIDATVPVENKKATKDLTKQLVRGWFNDHSEGGRYYDLGSIGEAPEKIYE